MRQTNSVHIQLFSALLLNLLFLTGCNIGSDSDYAGAADSEPLSSGLQSLNSGDSQRDFYLLLPDDHAKSIVVQAQPEASDNNPTSTTTSWPLLIAFHGTGGSYQSWVGDNANDLAEVVGDEAIMVFPDALPDGAGVRQWNFLTDDAPDLIFFEDLLMHLEERGVRYDPAKVFVTGHSSGGGFVHDLGCRYGDIIRGIAPSAGARLSGACVGGVGVLMSQGINDLLVPVQVARGTRDFWTKYNALDSNLSIAGVVPPCIDHSLLAPGAYDYPVVWCEHTEGTKNDFSGHAWGSFTSEALWQFFSTLSDIEPASIEPLGGGNAAVVGDADTTLTFALTFPDEMDVPFVGAITMYPADYINNPSCAIPSVILNFKDWVPGLVVPGSTVTYIDVPLDFEATPFNVPVSFPSEWTLQMVIYVEGGGNLLPAIGKDLRAITTISFQDKNTPITLPNPLQAEIVQVDVCAP